MRIAIVTFNFDKNRPGGVNHVVIKLLELLKDLLNASIEIVSFSNSTSDSFSVNLFQPQTYGNPRIGLLGEFENCKIIGIGSIGSEFEFLRYRKRRELTGFFEKYDFLIVVTGIIQFANVVPRITKPILVQCATRLKWERESQYPEMSVTRRCILKIQTPILNFQEFKVLKSGVTIMPENTRLENWLKSRTKNSPELWYPGIIVSHQFSSRANYSKRSGFFISVGRLNDPRKAWERLFLGYKKAYDRRDLPELVIVGSGEFSIKNRILLNQLENYPIRVFSNASNIARDELLSQASFFLQTSHEEGLGLAALEALSFGVPIIASETDGSKEYVFNGLTGYLVKQSPTFIEEFSEAILLAQEADYNLLHRNSREIFEMKFSSSVSRNRFREIVKLVLN